MYTIKTPKSRDDFKAYYALRYAVLHEPWGDPKGTEKDDYEPISQHFMAVDETNHIVGVVKLYEKAEGVGHVSHLAVSPDRQHEGIGHMLLHAVEQHAREHGFKIVGTMARVTATAFFEQAGFHIAGIPSPHLGTMHLVWMEKELTEP